MLTFASCNLILISNVRPWRHNLYTLLPIQQLLFAPLIGISGVSHHFVFWHTNPDMTHSNRVFVKCPTRQEYWALVSQDVDLGEGQYYFSIMVKLQNQLPGHMWHEVNLLIEIQHTGGMWESNVTCSERYRTQGVCEKIRGMLHAQRDAERRGYVRYQDNILYTQRYSIWVFRSMLSIDSEIFST